MSLPENQEFILKGEAPESDLDDEVFSENQSVQRPKQKTEGNIFDGEASESDNEIESFSKLSLTLNTAAEATETISSRSSPSIKQILNDEQSILHQKLCECNISLWNNLNNIVHQTVISASKQLTATDQMLVQSQVALLAASRSIKKVNELSTQVRDKTKDLLTAKFLPDIRVKHSG